MSAVACCHRYLLHSLLICLIIAPGLCVTPGETVVPGQGITVPSLSPGLSKGTENSVEFGRQLRPTTVTLPSQGGAVPALHPIEDGAEVYNRGCFAFNDWLIKGLINPMQKAWSFIFPRPVRTHIRNFGNNLAWPNRLINCMLQNKWRGAGSETTRFLCNTTLGLLGFFDPATKFGLKHYNEDWGQTFNVWGWDESSFFTIPFIGPCSWRDGLGKIPDAAFNPATYLFGASTLFNFNEMTFYIPTYNRVRSSEKDPYALTRDVWAISRQVDLKDFEIVNQKSDPAPTLGAVFLETKNHDFVNQAKTGSVRIPSTGSNLKYNYWLQKGASPLLFILGGAGTFRLSESDAAHAEMAFNCGFSVVTISSVFNWEFIQNAASESVPGYTPVDAQDVYVALNEIYKDMRHKSTFTSTALLGVSLGALDALYIARDDGKRDADDLQFERYIAINPPVDLIYALQQLDALYQAPLAWPAEERGQRLQNTLLKVAKLEVAKLENDGYDTKQPLPFDRIESNYLIGLTFRIILRDVIFASQERENLGVLQHGTTQTRRQPLYDEIAQFSFEEYMNKFILPYYLTGPGHSRVSMTKQEFIKSVNLWYIENEISGNPKIHIFTNKNDFLLRPQDLDWFEEKFTTRFTAFPEGGHIGNLYLPEVQEMVMQPLLELQSRSAARE